MDDERQTEMERERLIDLLHYQPGFCSLWHAVPLGFIPPSLHPSLWLFSLSELIMRELYQLRQISVSLPPYTYNIGSYGGRVARIICTPSTNTRSHLMCAGVSVFSLPVYFRLVLCCESSITRELMRNSFLKKWGVCYQGLCCEVVCAIRPLAKTHLRTKLVVWERKWLKRRGIWLKGWQCVGRSVAKFGPDWNISTTIGWIYMIFLLIVPRGWSLLTLSPNLVFR